MLYIDNKSAINLAKNPVFHGCSKHIDILYRFIQKYVDRGKIFMKPVKTDVQQVDTLTIALATARFEKVGALLGVKKLQE